MSRWQVALLPFSRKGSLGQLLYLPSALFTTGSQYGLQAVSWEMSPSVLPTQAAWQVPSMLPGRPWEEPQPWGGRDSINTLDFYSNSASKGLWASFQKSWPKFVTHMPALREMWIWRWAFIWLLHWLPAPSGFDVSPLVIVMCRIQKNWWASQGVILFSLFNIPAAQLLGFLDVLTLAVLIPGVLSLYAMDSFGHLMMSVDFTQNTAFF